MNIIYKRQLNDISMKMKKQPLQKTYSYEPHNENQKKYVTYLESDIKILLSLGPAGTGKTLFACQKAINQLKKEEIKKIIITRPTITVEEEEIGFLPGSIAQKMDPWTRPIFDIFHEYFSKSEVEDMLYNNKIEICPIAFMRGRTFKDTFIIADEMQNSSPNQMKMLMTRLGEKSRMVITGDLEQSDIKTENGLRDFLFRIKNFDKEITDIKMIEFEKSDIERSEIVKTVLELYDYDFKKTPTPPSTSPSTSPSTPKKKAEIKKEKLTIVPSDQDAALIPRHHYNMFFYKI